MSLLDDLRSINRDEQGLEEIAMIKDSNKWSRKKEAENT